VGTINSVSANQAAVVHLVQAVWTQRNPEKGVVRILVKILFCQFALECFDRPIHLLQVQK